MAAILILHGPNLNLLGTREPELYGSETLDDINKRLGAQAASSGHELNALQSSSEGTLVDAIHKAKASGVAFIVINPAAFTHTSVAIRDALLGVEIPFIEVHLSNVHARESFRHHSYLADIALGTIAGLGASGYEYALAAAIEHIEREEQT
ncbi:MAG: type II 3-dehydroquinate dehydratase [Gammaproteobacteria bacterium]|uniref:3-dehydroquinate dehydratase n=1 Tax=OM182 bacterium MED-G24 TaxID=1986255 RepID=A0A2A5WZP6_9GAMM|nr:type II 3-dehydroquinate dehydratase [Gammaproteobacteria bacterium]PDH41891.1 MAG: type II 3-dehydroquinate dehydratase [OM182 bacterium MED-G24]RPG27524.1 MAG: type II 3-dehydroquinate dehydratase [Gammaproteobacteria bacterium TMED50]|tara:strand:- start:1763 stop:2215 length:453 start_codon:yes stop_codon:yes gene_type:complete